MSAATVERIRKELAAGNPVAQNLVKGWEHGAGAVLKATPEQMPKGYTLQENYAPCPDDGYELKPVDYRHPELRCPKCGKHYKGGEYDAVWRHYYHLRMMSSLFAAAHAYAVTGEDKYARAAAPLLLWYADNYKRYRGGEEKKKGRRGFFLDNMLRESYFVYEMAVAYDLLYSWEGFSQAQRKHIEQDLVRESAITLMKRPTGLSNFQSFQNSGIGAAGFCLGDDKLIDFALHDPENGFDFQMSKGVVDGIWHEGSLAYHFFTLTALIRLAEAARHNGEDLYSNPGMKAMFYGPVSVAWPDGKIPRVGDDRSRGIDLVGQAQYWEVAYARYKDPLFAWLLQRKYRGSREARNPRYLVIDAPDELPAGTPLGFHSSLLPSAGIAFLRSQRLACGIKFGPPPAWHDHFDKLELMVWALGREIGLDPGMCAQYSFPERNWYRNTVAHNCVVVDEQKYGDCCGQARAWVAGDYVTLFQGVLDTAYQGVTLRRTVVLMRLPSADVAKSAPSGGGAGPSPAADGECFAVDLYEVEGGTIHDWVFHGAGKLKLDLPFSPGPRPGDDWRKLPAVVKPVQRKYHTDLTNGYEYLHDVRRGKWEKDWQARWETKDGALQLLMAGAPGTEVITALAPGYWRGDAVPLVLVRRQEEKSTYAAVFEPVPKDGSVGALFFLAADQHQGHCVSSPISWGEGSDNF
ncbi:MAG: heparinase II/III family protein, partial [Armatimonadetes bacterium]|nr:heparinase II/III family protein [Armatimonadota bacterium]